MGRISSVKYSDVNRNKYEEINSIEYTDSSSTGRTTALGKTLGIARLYAIRNHKIIGIFDNGNYLGRVIAISMRIALYTYIEKGDIRIKRVFADGTLMDPTDDQLYTLGEVLRNEY